VALEEVDERRCGEGQCVLAAGLARAWMKLSFEEPTPVDRLREPGHARRIRGELALVFSGEGDAQLVMKILHPDRVETPVFEVGRIVRGVASADEETRWLESRDLLRELAHAE